LNLLRQHSNRLPQRVKLLHIVSGYGIFPADGNRVAILSPKPNIFDSYSLLYFSGFLRVGDTGESNYRHHDEHDNAKKTDALFVNFIVHYFSPNMSC